MTRSAFRRRRQAGGLLLAMVVAMTAVATLGAGLVSTVSTSAVGSVELGRQKQAAVLAASGLRYAQGRNREGVDLLTLDNASFDLGAQGRFTLDVAQPGGSGFRVTATARLDPGTSREVRHVAFLDIAPAASPLPPTPSGDSSDDYAISSAGALTLSNQNDVQGNVAFGEDGRSLFIAADTRLLRIRLKSRGLGY